MVSSSGPKPKSISEHAQDIGKLVPQFRLGGTGANFQNALTNSFLPSQSLYQMANRYANPSAMQGAPMQGAPMQGALMQFAQPYQMVEYQQPPMPLPASKGTSERDKQIKDALVSFMRGF